MYLSCIHVHAHVHVIQYNTIQYSYSIIQYNTIQCIQYSAVQYLHVQYNAHNYRQACSSAILNSSICTIVTVQYTCSTVSNSSTVQFHHVY